MCCFKRFRFQVLHGRRIGECGVLECPALVWRAHPHTSSQSYLPWHHVGSQKFSMVGVFMPQKLANATKASRHHPPEPSTSLPLVWQLNDCSVSKFLLIPEVLPDGDCFCSSELHLWGQKRCCCNLRYNVEPFSLV